MPRPGGVRSANARTREGAVFVPDGGRGAGLYRGSIPAVLARGFKAAGEWRAEGSSLDRLIIDAAALNYPLTRRIRSRLPGVPEMILRTAEQENALRRNFDEAPDPLRAGKRTLRLRVHRGKFVKPCPCTPRHVGCGYVIINLNLQCPHDCTYCILQTYLKDPWITLFVNLEDLWTELDGILTQKPGRYVRFGTGELGDSLALDSLTGLSEDLIGYFRGRPSADFELKTKTVHIGRLLKIDPPGNIVVSWSLNTERAALAEERGAPPVRARIQAAKAVAEKGYRVGFHFDPLILHPGWKRGYADVVDALLRNIPAARIAWISLGSLRLPPALKKRILARFPASHILEEEFIPGLDGKLRYFRPLRAELIRHVARRLRTQGGERIPLYLCMESLQLWKAGLGENPGGKRAVEASLSPRGDDEGP